MKCLHLINCNNNNLLSIYNSYNKTINNCKTPKSMIIIIIIKFKMIKGKREVLQLYFLQKIELKLFNNLNKINNNTNINLLLIRKR